MEIEHKQPQNHGKILLPRKAKDFDDVWRMIGGMGRYPKALVLFSWYLTIVVDLHQFVQIYYGTPPNFHCINTRGYENTSSSCGENQCRCTNCSYIFDSSGFSSAVSEWNLICSRGHLRAMTQSVYNAGLLIGSLAFGILSDKFGRKITMFLSLALMGAFGFGSAYANSLLLFAIMRFCSGFSTSGCLVTKFVYAIEMCPLSYRTAVGVLSNIFVVIGALILTLIAYLIPDWRILMLVVTIPGLPGLLLWRWILESPRWLLAKGKIQQAQSVLETFSAGNGVQVDSDQLRSLIKDIATASERKETKKNTSGVLDLVRTPRMRKRTLILSYNWLINAIVFLGLTLNAKNLGGSFHLNVFIMFAVTLPGVMSLWFIIGRCGRRVSYCTYMLLGGVACLLILAVPKGPPTDVHVAVKILVVSGVFCVSATFSLVYIYHSELSPTLLRNLSLGVGSMIARAGGIIAPYFVFLNDYMQHLSFIILGMFGFTAGFVALLLPETLHSPMPQTVSEVEDWAEDYRLPCRKTETQSEVSLPGENDGLCSKKETIESKVSTV